MTYDWEDSVERYLEHPHLWVQLAASRLFGQLFACWKPSEVAAASGKEESNGYLQQAVTEKVVIVAALTFVGAWNSFC